jgi:uncharacterized repeat protein (TIGR01451 family)
MSHTSQRRTAVRILVFILTLLVVASSVLSTGRPALAANPAPLQYYFISVPEDDTLAMFFANGGGNTARSPVRSVTYISIGTDGTLVYYDQWEDGSYDADIANPGSNVYNAITNPDGTQIWGDGVLGNGCPPSINNTPNPCLVPGDDVFENGDVIVLDNNVVVQGAVGGPYSRNPAQIYFDGRDRFGSTLPVAVARAMWPSIPGSLMAGGVEVLDSSRLGTSYTSPVGENTATPTAAFEDVRWFILATTNGTTLSMDVDGPGGAAAVPYNLNAGEKLAIDGIQAGATLIANYPVAVDVVTSDIGSTYEFRWFSLLPDSAWKSDYYTPIGTAPQANNAGCSEVWLFNPGASAITVSYDVAGGASPDGTVNVPARGAAVSPRILYNSGARFYTTGATPPVFLPFSITDCSQQTASGQINDWGSPLFPADQLTPEVLVGWAPGCTDESYQGVCLDADNTGRTDSRSVIWLTPLANTTIYVDHDGSGISCPTGTGAEVTINATALNSYRVNHNPTSRTYVHDNFSTVAYNRVSDNIGYGLTPAAWASNWTETGDDGAANAGAIWITGGALQFRDVGGNETNLSIQRSRNLAGQYFSRLSFRIQFGGTYNPDDAIAVEISPDGGSTWYQLDEIQGPISYATGQLANRVYRISPYNTVNTTIRFRTVGNLEAGDTWSIDEVHIDNAPDGDFDMTGAYIRTCNDVAFSAAYGQDPALSFSGDDEALDLGTFVPPYGARIAIDKVASSAYASPGDTIVYTYSVRSILNTTVNNVRVVDDLCEPEVYVSGDDGDNQLEPSEVWLYTCTTEVFVDTTNTAIAYALIGAGEISSTPDQATVAVRSAIGDFIWVDEDGDGDQDAGEPGIPNVRVTLTGTDISGQPVSLATYTDARGHYLFPDVPPSNASGYTITVDTTTLPAGLAANPTYDENGIGTPHTTTVVLGSETEHMTADFGYNWTSPADTNGNTGTGAIGDRVWIDADGDGLQDPNEPGLNNVVVQLFSAGPDGLFGTADDVLVASTTTNYIGNYIFTGLSAGAYVVRLPLPPAGYTQTGDPDGTLDNQTTAPIVLAPGDVFLNADFGYQPNTGVGATIGDTLWIDANRNNAQDAGEPPLAGVSVSLIRDLNGNGVWDAGEPIIATDLTDASGQYRFNGVPIADGVGADDYLVWVNDTANVLQGLTATYDADGGNPASGFASGLGISAVTDLAGDDLNQDFAYAPSGHNAGEGLIGDTVWLDANNNGVFDPGEGVEGVLISLLDNNGDVLTRVRTNENGQYFFGGLAAGTYTVQIDYNTLPGNGLGLTNFVDPDGGTAHQSTLTIAAGEINLAQDFGYRASTPNSVGGTIWQDTNADGTQDAGETTVFAGITVALYEDTNLDGILGEGDRLIGTTTTDASGNYNFTNLPDATYFVDVTDDASRLLGYWHTLGSQGKTADGQSKTDVYRISLSGGENRSTVDFGYYRDPASIGDFVWNDLDRDGIQDAGEPGIVGATVRLTITWPNGSSTTVTTVTDANGNYRFGNLLLDEDFNGIGAGQPSFVVTFETPGGYTPTLSNQGGNDDIDSDGASVTATPVQGQAITNIDSGFKQVVFIGDRIWYDYDGDGVQDANEPGLPGVVVELDNGACTVGVDCPTRTTDANGNYAFDDLPLGTYTVIVRTATLPAGMNQTGDPDATFDHQHTVVASSPGVYDTVDFGYQGTASLGDYVWNDMDGDGTQDAGESGIGGVTVWVDLDNDGIQDPTEPSDVTDANGAYLIEGLTAGTFTVRTAGSVLSGATPTYDLDGVGTANQTSVTLTAGQDRTDVDFGYRFTALSISKLSSAGGTVVPGQTINYTIVVRNNTASQQTGIAITDPLPTGTTYVVSSTVATGYVLTPFTNTYADDFDPAPASYSGNDGNQNFTGAWIESDAVQSPTAGNVQLITDLGDFSLRPGDNPGGAGNVANGSIYRVAGNLSACATVVLTYDYRRDSMEAADHVYLDMSSDGGTAWTNAVRDITNGTDAAYQASGSVDVTTYRANLALRFRSVYNDGGAGAPNNDRAYIDNVVITCNGNALVLNTRDNIPGGANPDLVNGTPHNLVVASDNFALNPGQSMTVTFQVVVNDPVPGGVTSINNTASVTSTQQTTPQQASTVDYLPLANLGDRVWYDTNNNGVQDSGEPGISGVTVQLYDPGPDGVIGGGDDVLVATTTTNDSGNYAFNNVVADTYFVQFVQPTGYSFTAQDAGADNVDSDANVSTGQTGLITLTGGSTNTDMDAGLANSQLDYGDLPSSYNNTILGDNGPRHLIGSLRLGANIGPDPEGQEDPAAALDTFDDGVTRGTGNWTNGATVSINLDVQGGAADVGVWIDWGGDGTFDPATDFFSFSGLPAGANVVQITVPNNSVYAVGRAVNVRVRAFDPANLPGGSLDAGDFVGFATNGEVEDYRWNFGPTAVTLNSLAARAEAGDLPLLLMFVLMGAGAVLLIAWAKRHRIA